MEVTESIYKFPEDLVETKYGSAVIWSTGLDHIGWRGPDGEFFVVNGVKVTARVDLHLREDGSYRPGVDDTPYRHYGAFIGRRFENFGDVTDSARAKLIDEAERVVTEYLATDEGRELVLIAEGKRLAQEAERLGKEEADIERKLAANRAKQSENSLARLKLDQEVSA